jgi:hypothetical protein
MEAENMIVAKIDQFPSPASYKLPLALEYPEHDVTKNKNPVYSVFKDHPEFFKEVAEIFGVGAGQTRFGKDRIPAPTIGVRRKEASNTMPGPFAYAPEHFASLKGKTPPAFSIGSRIRDPAPQKMPAPNEYYIPSCLGSKVPHMRSSPAHSIFGKPSEYEPERSPGPAAYKTMDPDKYKRRLPTYTMTGRNRDTVDRNPEPVAYKKY